MPKENGSTIKKVKLTSGIMTPASNSKKKPHIYLIINNFLCFNIMH